MGGFKLGKMTLGSVFKKPETVQYPFESKPAPAGRKGHIVVNIDDCVFCGLCAKACPAMAIEVDKAQRTWSIDYFQCVQCFSCTSACHKGCLSMDVAFPQAAASKGVHVVQAPVAEDSASEQVGVG